MAIINNILASCALVCVSVKEEPIVTFIAIPERFYSIIQNFKPKRLCFNNSFAVRNLRNASHVIRTEHQRMVSQIVFRVIEPVSVQLKVKIVAFVAGSRS